MLPRHLEHVTVLCERHPGLRLVIDHLAKPPIGTGDLEPWASLLARAAEFPNVYAKLSGLYPGGTTCAAGRPKTYTPSCTMPWNCSAPSV